ncbi:hypothetical protein DUNSADRAFT_15684 [Dunaliella salina]|uniref:Uncharacterized protein n=1 Tax=Dunaliella salina TaxID=3046 RepID=A0ABQ7G4Y9_DUNSA|nr:hypothetical protein DUNSADRAFT_15684 [Dunaliella salina]|eukprot:KAF5829659.1 hypothetical protein DUNSADRAFT_15684 [Dunaliella salina]
MEDSKSKVQTDADARLLQSNTFQKHIEATQRELKEQLNDHQRYIKTVENELAHLQLQLKLNVGPRKMASEFLRGKIEAQNEVLAGVRRRHTEAKKALAEVEAELQAEEQEKDRLCSELNLLVAESTAAQLAKLEELKNHLDMLSRWSSRMGHSTSSAEADGLCQKAHAFATGAGLQVPQPPGTHTHMLSNCPKSRESPTEQRSPIPAPATHSCNTSSHSPSIGSAEARTSTHLPSPEEGQNQRSHTSTPTQPSSSQPAASAPPEGAASTSAPRAVPRSISPNPSAGSALSHNCEVAVSTPPSASSHLNSSQKQGEAGSTTPGEQGQGNTRSAGLVEGSCTQAPRAAPRRGGGRKPLSAGRVPRSGMPVAAGGGVNNTVQNAAAGPPPSIQGSTEAAVAHVLHHGAPLATADSTQRPATPTEQHAERPRRSNQTILGAAQQNLVPKRPLETQRPVAANMSKGKGEFSGFDV